MKRVVIVGGGISGLAAAHALQPHARESLLEVTLLEASPRPGGKIRTEAADGCMFEHGPDMFLTRKPEMVRLCSALGVELEAPRAGPQRASILRDGQLHPLPTGFTGVLPARPLPLLRSPLLPPRARLRAVLEPLVPAWRGPDLSVSRFFSRRFGRQAYECLIAPMLAGVYGDGETLSMDATLPELRALERRHGSLTRGMRARQRADAPDGVPGRSFASAKGGMESVVDALVEQMDSVSVHTRTPVLRVERRGDAYVILSDAAEHTADAVILALPANHASPLLQHVDGELSDALRGIPHESVAMALLAFDDEDVPRAAQTYGWLIPRSERRLVRAVTCVTSKFAARAPEGVTLYRLFFAAPNAVEQSDGELLQAALDELARTLGLRATPRLARLVRWRDAMPRYTLGHPARVAAVATRLRRLPGLFIAGPSLVGAGLPDCVRAANAAARDAYTYVTSA